MKTALAVSIVLSLGLSAAAQSGRAAAGSPPPQQTPSQTAATGLNAILAELQRTTLAANTDLSKLRIERWKADESEKQQMQQVAASLQKNITMAMPGMINEVQATPGSVSKAFKLYHDLNLVYEFLNSLAEAAGAYGKKEEYGPLANDASSLDNVRQSLSSYIEQTANTLETQARQPAPAQQAQATQAPKKIVIDEGNVTPKKTRKKKPAATSTPPTSPPPQ